MKCIKHNLSKASCNCNIFLKSELYRLCVLRLGAPYYIFGGECKCNQAKVSRSLNDGDETLSNHKPGAGFCLLCCI